MSELFSPISIGKLELPNRIVIPPMDQYSAKDGHPSNWHKMHYGHLAVSGAGLLILEATAVEPKGRISNADLGIWNDELQREHTELVSFIRSFSDIPLAVQLGHAGRKGSTLPPFEGGGPLPESNGAWVVCGPTADKYCPVSPAPEAMSETDIHACADLFAQAARRSAAAGYDAIEIHAAHGYLVHQFLSPLANKRSDAYGGSLENRMRFPLEVFTAISAAVPAGFPIGVRISGSDFAEGGWDIESSIAFSKELEKAGCAFIHVSGGGLTPNQKIRLAPGYQVSLAARVKEHVTMPVIAVGLVTEAEIAASIVETGQADMVAIGRAILYDPRWPWHAAAKLGKSIRAPKQYLRCEPRNAKGLFV
ncbi:MAG: NADPH dehydrogenase [Desulfovibrio sp.]